MGVDIVGVDIVGVDSMGVYIVGLGVDIAMGVRQCGS